MLKMNQIERQKYLQLFTNLTVGLSQTGASWCACFGTLLGIVRDHKISDDQDLDIGILSGHLQVYSMLRSLVPVKNFVLDDCTGMPYQLAYSQNGRTVDVYFWYRREGHAFHCFDENLERPANGVLKEYHFKGIPETVFWPRPEDVAKVDTKAKLMRWINADNTYAVPVPGIETEGLTINVPFGFGAALDCWYPGCWAIPNPQYGQSRAIHEFTVQTCRGIGWR
jgi:hypothetical protein